MNKFVLREVKYDDIFSELEDIGFDTAYRCKISEKFRYKNIKISDLALAQANILKQTALIYGADCAVNREVITGKVESSDVILCGSYSQLRKIADKLKSQPFKLATLGDCILELLNINKIKTKLVGILNVTPDSFSDGGLYLKSDDACKKLISLIEDGADMVDIGAESTRPNSIAVEPKEQICRLKDVFNFIQKENLNIKISVDTRSSEVADFVLNSGANIINDVSGFDYDENMPKVIANYKAGCVIQHYKGKPEAIPTYGNLLDEISLFLDKKIKQAKDYGIQEVIVDPGIGFGKSGIDNVKIIKSISSFKSLQCPIMVGVSRKRFLGINNDDNLLKDALSLTYSYPLIEEGVDYLRVHNVKMHKAYLNSIPT